MIGRPPFRLYLHPPAQLKCRPRYQFPNSQHLTRPFSTTIRLLDNAINHYEVLKLPQTATKAELKKQFYALSKETHPDRLPDDPKAGERFSQLSESYSILADEEKRRKFDRDYFRHHDRRGSESNNGSGSFAGSRPASGLSKRRGTFRGPPPSFYAQGGYGGTSRTTAEQQAANEKANYQGGTFNAGAYQDRSNADFNPRPIHRTQSAEDIRRMQRRAAEIQAMQAEVDALTDTGFWGRFMIVCTIVVLGVSIGGMVVARNPVAKGGMLRGDGSKRGGEKNEWAKG